ncbi:MAG: N-acetylglucosamine-6-phosphate deacetylase [Actinobacteria bacterium]|nr:N-acetylglucosamine-6-phosphate deacetylase [Actinomycetota bacterium]
MYLFKNCKIITPFEVLKSDVLVVKDDKISFIGKADEAPQYEKIVDCKGRYIVPGFIDIHVHGANGVDAVEDDIAAMVEFKVKSGTTAMYPTVWTAEIDRMSSAIKRIIKHINNGNGTKVLGINLEGPFLNPNYGAQQGRLNILPDEKVYKNFTEIAQGNLKIMTVAPELSGAIGMIKYLTKNGVIVSIGHSEADSRQVDEAIDAGAKAVTHIFNAMGTGTLRDRGVKPVGLGEVLLVRDVLMAEVMADRDCVHVPVEILKIVVRCKGVKNVILITDSMKPTGLPEDTFALFDGRKIYRHGDILRLDNNDIAGSVMTMDMAIRNMINNCGVRLHEAVKMATYNPAKLLGIDKDKGSIDVGKDADIVLIDEDINVFMTMIGGKILFNKN